MSNLSASRLYTWMAPSLLGVAAAAGCASDPEPARPAASTAALFAALAPASSSFVIDVAAGGTIAGQGTSFVIPGGTIFLPGGAPADLDTNGDGVADSKRVKGKVTVTLRELLSPQDMALAGRPTVTSDGQLLETGGAFDLTIEGGGAVLQVTALRNLRIQPAQPPSTTAGMELWLANANAPGEFGWNRPPGGPVPAEAVGPGFFVPVVPSSIINQPTTSKNIDLPRPPPPKVAPVAPVDVRFAGVDPDDAAVFFFPAGVASVVRLERDAEGAYVGPAGVMHEDLRGRLVAVSAAGGRYFLQEREVSLAEARSFVVDPVEVTRDELRERLGAR